MTDQKITMDGKWAYREDPYSEVRVLCVDRPGNRPVLSLDRELVREHHQNGRSVFIVEYDLVPLKVKREPREVWVVEHRPTDLAFGADSLGIAFHNETMAHRSGGKVTHFREVMDEPLSSKGLAQKIAEDDARVHLDAMAVFKRSKKGSEE